MAGCREACIRLSSCANASTQFAPARSIGTHRNRRNAGGDARRDLPPPGDDVVDKPSSTKAERVGEIAAECIGDHVKARSLIETLAERAQEADGLEQENRMLREMLPAGEA